MRLSLRDAKERGREQKFEIDGKFKPVASASGTKQRYVTQVHQKSYLHCVNKCVSVTKEGLLSCPSAKFFFCSFDFLAGVCRSSIYFFRPPNIDMI